MATAKAAGARSSLSIRRVVVGTDLSLDGDRAVRRTATLPIASRGRVAIVHVLPRRLEPSVDSVVRGAAEIALEREKQKLVRAFRDRSRQDVEVDARVVRGRAAEQIDRFAEAYAADLVVVGRRGQTRLRDVVLGSTARQILRHGHCAVLVVGLAPKAPYRRAIVGFDFSRHSQRAARWVAAVAAPTARVLALHTFDDPLRGLPPTLAEHAGSTDIASAVDDRRRHLTNAIDRLGKRTASWRLRIEAGDPRQALLDTARREKAELIAIGPTGKTALQRTLIGSVAEAVLDQARCDVLLARGGRAGR